MTTTYRCDNCDFWTDNEETFPTLSEVPDLGERLDAGSIVPDGACPKCKAFVYREKALATCGGDECCGCPTCTPDANADNYDSSKDDWYSDVLNTVETIKSLASEEELDSGVQIERHCDSIITEMQKNQRDTLNALKALMATEHMLRDPGCQVMQDAKRAIADAKTIVYNDWRHDNDRDQE